MSLKNKLRSLITYLGKIPSKLGKTKRSPKVLVAVYLLILASVIGVYALRGPLGEIIINADPLPFSLGGNNEVDADLETDSTLTKDSPTAETLAPVGDDAEEEELEEEKAAEDIPAFASTFPLLWPLEGKVVVTHGEMFAIENQKRSHRGIDIEAAKGTEVKAAWPGTVKETGKSLMLGNYIELSHGDNYFTYYANLDEITVSEGSTVESGTKIGTSGTGAIIDAGPGEHLHFEVYKIDTDTGEEKLIDPLELLTMD